MAKTRGAKRAKPPAKEPKLLAFLICERVDTAQDGMQTLVRLFDRSTLNAQIVASPDEQLPPLQVPHEFTVFARFGGGMGTFKHWLKIEPPGGPALDGPETDFWLRDPAMAHNIVARLRIVVTEAGRYWIVCYLEGREVARIPWNVEINIQRVSPPRA